MALFRTLSAPEPLPPVVGEGIVLRAPQMADFAAWAKSHLETLTPREGIEDLEDPLRGRG